MAMMQRVVFIEQRSTPFDAGIDTTRATLQYERLEWSTFEPDSLRACNADLIVPVAVPITPSARSLFRWLRDHTISPSILAVLADDADEHFMRDVAEAVDDFVLWPIRNHEFRRRVARILPPAPDNVAELKACLVEEVGLARIVGDDPGFLSMTSKIPVVARSGRPVVITGETGTGKELFARAIHHLSPRRSFPFVPVDCGGVPDQLFENELFGHARGAFTDAHGDHKGLIAMAEGGTLFLDEIDALSLQTQAKLLRFLQERAYKPLGADRFVRSDVNVIAASNRDLESLAREKAFRPDLYFRLNVIRLQLLALRDRRGDIPVLARHFLEQACADARVSRKTLTAPAIRTLSLHDWPGNARELLNVIQRAVTFAEGPVILPCHLEMGGPVPSHGEVHDTFHQARASVIGRFEEQYVEELLRLHHGNITRAAAAAGCDRRAFGRLMKKYRIDRLAG